MKKILSHIPKLSLLSSIFLIACQTTAVANPAPAVLDSGDARSLETLKVNLAKAMNKPTIQLGAGDPTTTSKISVLPKRNRSNPYGGYQNQASNLALPAHFDLIMKGNMCYAVRQSTGEEILLEGVVCRRLTTP